MFKTFGWINTHLPLIIPPMMSNVFGIFLLRQFFMTLPMDLDEAARIDGANSLRIYGSIIIPLSKPALATLALFTFRTSWNQLLPALIYINSEKKQLITVGLTMFQGEFSSQYHLMMAGAVISIIPIIILFASFQKYFIRGIALTGIKG
jgi:ABC-type glycerol-3-phosphate transport system permease component